MVLDFPTRRAIAATGRPGSASVAADEQAASEAFERLRQGCVADASPDGATMGPGGGSIVRVSGLDGDPQGSEVTADGEANGELSAQHLTVARRGATIVMLIFRDVCQVRDLDLPALREAAGEAVDRVS